MRIDGRGMKNGKLPLLPIFLAGVVLGILLMNFAKGVLLENTGLLDEYALYHMKYMTVDSNALFFYVFRIRCRDVLMLAVMATTYLGLAMVGLMTFWYGLSAGMFASAVVLRYGMKGVLFGLTGIFPQYLCYVPAAVLLLLWCEMLCRSIYFKDSTSMEDKTGHPVTRRLLQLTFLLIVVIIGCALESYVNPFLVTKFLKIF